MNGRKRRVVGEAKKREKNYSIEVSNNMLGVCGKNKRKSFGSIVIRIKRSWRRVHWSRKKANE
jgi:hypothetical protein